MKLGNRIYQILILFFFFFNFSKADEKISSTPLINIEQIKPSFEELANERLILRKMEQYKIPNSLRLTIGNEVSNNHFIKTIRSILK